MYTLIISSHLCDVFNRSGSDNKTSKTEVLRRSVQGVYQEFDEHLKLLTWMDKIWKQMDKWKAKDGGRENWMCSKWCRVHGFAVLAASCRESRREAFAVRMRLRRHCLVFPISSRFCRIGRSSVCVVAMTTIVSRKVVRTQKYKTRSFFFCNVSAKYGVTRFKV